MKLEDIEKENPFDLPEDYFNQLENKVMHKVHRRHQWSRFAKVASPTAVVVFLGLLAFNLWFTNPEQETSAPTLAENTATTEETVYLAENSMPANALSTTDLAADEELTELVFEEEDLDNSDYMIIAYYDNELASLDYLY